MSGPTQLGAGHNIVPELAVQEALVIGLHKLVQDEAAVDELVQRLDTLKNGTQDEWTKALREDLRDILDPSSERYVRVNVGYPTTEERLPWLSIIADSGGENVAEAIAGDEHHRHYTLTRTTEVSPATAADVPDNESLLIKHAVMGTGEQTTVQVGCWSVAPERSLLLAAAARWAIFHEKGLLAARGVHDISWRTSGMSAPAPELLPRVGYLPLLIVTLSWTYRETRSTLVPNRVTIGSGTFSA